MSSPSGVGYTAIERRCLSSSSFVRFIALGGLLDFFAFLEEEGVGELTLALALGVCEPAAVCERARVVCGDDGAEDEGCGSEALLSGILVGVGVRGGSDICLDGVGIRDVGGGVCAALEEVRGGGTTALGIAGGEGVSRDWK
jgi:hypothetical protein